MKHKIINGYRLNYNETIKILKEYSNEELFKLADDLRVHFYGNRLSTCIIMNAKSGKCPQDCKWCSQSIHYKTNIETHSLSEEKDVLKSALVANKAGVKMFSLVTSGKKLSRKDINKITEIYKNVKTQISGLNYCASLGLLSLDDLQRLYDSGVRRYHCNIETAPSFFQTLCSTHTIEEKIQTLTWAKSVGFEVCSGGIIGMGETMEQRVEMAIVLQENEILSIPINILIPIKGTPLENIEIISDEEILKTFAIFRIINPEADIRFAGGRIRIQHIQEKALKCGISASMVGDLLTTAGLNLKEDLKQFKNLNYKI